MLQGDDVATKVQRDTRGKQGKSVGGWSPGFHLPGLGALVLSSIPGELLKEFLQIEKSQFSKFLESVRVKDDNAEELRTEVAAVILSVRTHEAIHGGCLGENSFSWMWDGEQKGESFEDTRVSGLGI